MFKKSTYLILTVMTFTIFAMATMGDGRWLSQVPQKSRSRTNPFKDNADAAMAGAKLFRENCAKCHASNAEGRDPRLNLHTARIKNSTAGELEWLLTNGSMRNGMPSWSRLPENQRWQLVTFLKNLQ